MDASHLMDTQLTHTLTASPALHAFLGLFAGALLGLFHFAALWANVRLYIEGGAVGGVAIQILRFGLLIAVLAALAKLGAAALLGSAFGLFVARGFVLRRFGRTP
jgi:F1F0 ATPase subunit 2